MFDAAAVTADVVVAPHRLEFGAEPAELVHKGCHFGRRAGARRIRPEGSHHEPGDGFPIKLRSADARIAEDRNYDSGSQNGLGQNRRTKNNR